MESNNSDNVNKLKSSVLIIGSGDKMTDSKYFESSSKNTEVLTG